MGAPDYSGRALNHLGLVAVGILRPYRADGTLSFVPRALPWAIIFCPYRARLAGSTRVGKWNSNKFSGENEVENPG